MRECFDILQLEKGLENGYTLITCIIDVVVHISYGGRLTDARGIRSSRRMDVMSGLAALALVSARGDRANGKTSFWPCCRSCCCANSRVKRALRSSICARTDASAF